VGRGLRRHPRRQDAGDAELDELVEGGVGVFDEVEGAVEDRLGGAGDADHALGEGGVDCVLIREEAEDDGVGAGGEKGLGLARGEEVVRRGGDEVSGPRAHHRGDREGGRDAEVGERTAGRGETMHRQVAAELEPVGAGPVSREGVRKVVDGDFDERVRHKTPMDREGSVVYRVKRVSI
jgi:hypothetical protein